MKILFAHAGTPKETELMEALVQLNYEVTSVSRFEEALSAASRDRPGLVLASVSGPARGFDLCSEIRSRADGPAIPVLLTSESAEAAAQIDAHRSGTAPADGYLLPPVSTDEVIDSIERLIGLPPPPEEDEVASPVLPGASGVEVRQLKREVEELQEQVAFYKEQAREVSISGEKNVRDATAAVTDLQSELEKAKEEMGALRDELALLKSTAARQERDVASKEKLVKELKAEADKRQAELQRDVDDLRKTLSEADQKHKKALGALREFYKGKSGNASKLEKRIAELEEELKKSTAEEARLAGELAKARELLSKVRSVFS